jgi:flagellar FliL protein
MAEDSADAAAKPARSGGRGLILGLVAALLFGGGGFYATWSGLVGGHAGEAGHAASEVAPLPPVSFVPMEPLVISLGPTAQNRHLRFTGQLEVAKEYTAEVTLLLPRVIDLLNGYLRAVDVAMLEDPSALIRLRAQMLRRVQVVTGEGRVRDLLVTEFVLN